MRIIEVWRDKSVSPIIRFFRIGIKVVSWTVFCVLVMTIATIATVGWMDVRWKFASPLLQSFYYNHRTNKYEGEYFIDKELNKYIGNEINIVVKSLSNEGFYCNKSTKNKKIYYCYMEIDGIICVPTWRVIIDVNYVGNVTRIRGRKSEVCL